VLGIPIGIIGAFTGAYSQSTTCDSNDVCTKHFDFSSGTTANLIGIVIGILYVGYFVGLRTQTVGHMAVGIKVVDVNTGAAIGFGRAALRWIVLGVTGAICTLGYWTPFFDKQRRQGWHDKAAKSVAIPSRP
jgi:uncharacterized RDD family membrane protein YckC